MISAFVCDNLSQRILNYFISEFRLSSFVTLKLPTELLV